MGSSVPANDAPSATLLFCSPRMCFWSKPCGFGLSNSLLGSEKTAQIPNFSLWSLVVFNFAFCISFTLHFVYTIGTPPWTNSNIDFNFIHNFLSDEQERYVAAWCSLECKIVKEVQCIFPKCIFRSVFFGRWAGEMWAADVLWSAKLLRRSNVH